MFFDKILQVPDKFQVLFGQTSILKLGSSSTYYYCRKMFKILEIGMTQLYNLIFFLTLPNNVGLTSLLYRMHKNKSSTRFWVIQSQVEVHPDAIGKNRYFGHKLWVFMSTMSCSFIIIRGLLESKNHNAKIIFRLLYPIKKGRKSEN